MSGFMPSHVLMTADTAGGVWNYALQLTEGLGRHDIEVTLVTMGRKPSLDQLREVAPLSNLHLIATDLKVEWMADAAADLREAGELLLDLEAKLAPDIVHVNGYANAAAGFLAPVVVVAHSCVPTWWQACRGTSPPPEWNDYRRRLRNGIAAADCLVAPSHAFLQAFRDANGWPRRVRVIPNGRDPLRFRRGDKRPFVLAAGRVWDEAKNLQLLARAAVGLRYPVLIAGDGDLPDPPANVTALGRLGSAALAERMAEAAVFAAPARYEPFGLAILEAALSGCALVLGDIPTLRELWDGAAEFIDPDDPDALAAALDGLLADPERAALAGSRARARGLRYGAAAMARSYLTLYEELARETLPARAPADPAAEPASA